VSSKQRTYLRECDYDEPSNEDLGIVPWWTFERLLGGVFIVGAVLGSLLIGSAAFAQTVPRDAARLEWTNPTKNTDDTNIPTSCPSGQAQCGKLTVTRLEYGTCTGTAPNLAFGTKVGEITVAQPAVTALISALVPRMYCFRAFARNDYAAESASSNVDTKTIVPPTPGAPVLTVVNPTAYRIDQGSHDKIAWQRIGTVELNTKCQSDYITTIKGVTKYMIGKRILATPVAALPYQVWAECA
jgi:hypothetical protein